MITSKIRTTRQKSQWVDENPYAMWNLSFHPYTRWKFEQWGLNPSSWDPCHLLYSIHIYSYESQEPIAGHMTIYCTATAPDQR